jgi:hypothetical protein
VNGSNRSVDHFVIERNNTGEHEHRESQRTPFEIRGDSIEGARVKEEPESSSRSARPVAARAGSPARDRGHPRRATETAL